MYRWLTSLAAWWRLPTQDGFAELDRQIDKLRTLRDSYQTPRKDSRHDNGADVKKDGDLLLLL